MSGPKLFGKYGAAGWCKIIGLRANNGGEVLPGTSAEALRNAEHYLYGYMEVSNDSYSWGGSCIV